MELEDGTDEDDKGEVENNKTAAHGQGGRGGAGEERGTMWSRLAPPRLI